MPTKNWSDLLAETKAAAAAGTPLPAGVRRVGKAKVSPTTDRRRHPAAFTNSDSSIIVTVDTYAETFWENLAPANRTKVKRVRMHRTTVTKGFEDFAETTTTFLDGSVLVEVFQQDPKKPSKREWKTMPTQSPVRTQDVADFGRLKSAVQQFLELATQFDAKTKPNEQQMESLLTTYQHLLEWEKLAKEGLDDASGQIDLCRIVLRKFLDQQ